MLLQRGCTWLTLMPLLLSLSTGELSFYRDALPETSEDLALEHMARYLKTQRLQRLHRSYQPMFLSPEHDSLQLDHQNVLEALSNKALLRENMLRQKLKALHHRPNKYSMKIIETEYPSTYYNRDFKHLDYSEEKQRKENDKRLPKNLESAFDMEKERMLEKFMMNTFHRKYTNHNHGMDMFMHHEGGREMESVVQPAAMAAEVADEPEFTFSFDDSNLEERHPFAVKPNDPRYYSDAPFSSDNFDQQDASRANWKKEKSANKGDNIIRQDDDTRSINRKRPDDSPSEFDTSELERFEHHPIIVPINRDLNNDIYFIAIVAGCSAAAMFALVLVSLTWCRLQRGAKAAADIEYPAYGVTGPNKDVSPSGDQRLAQSAQMYHFQHQKQQIIAMEKEMMHCCSRTSATRDPGSLSEAESDEENEEGDYTVYECPGLASTGEMEVKNPMFHDDPTPATPVAQGNNKEEDHI